MSKKKNKEVRIKVCPFCSCADTEKIRMQELDGLLAVTCLQCGCIGPVADAEDSAVSNWNSRDIVILSDSAYKKLTEGEDVEEG